MIEWFWISHFMFRVIISIQQLLPTFLCTPAPPPPPPCCISPVISGTVRSPCSLEWSCSLHWNTHSTKFSDTMEKHFHMKHIYKNGQLWWSLNKVLFWRIFFRRQTSQMETSSFLFFEYNIRYVHCSFEIKRRIHKKGSAPHLSNPESFFQFYAQNTLNEKISFW